MKLKDRVALVTGGGSGIGRAICERFADEGARVVVNDVRQEAAEATAKALGAGARAIAADVADSQAVRAMFAVIDREHGRLDVLVNNAAWPWGPATTARPRCARARRASWRWRPARGCRHTGT